MNIDGILKETKYILKERFSQYDIFMSNNDIQKEITKRINDFNYNLEKHLKNDNPFKDLYSVYEEAKNSFIENEADKEALFNDIENYRLIAGDYNADFFSSKINSLEKDEYNNEIIAIRKSVFNSWKDELDKQYMNWVLNEIDKYRKKFFQDMEKFFDYLNNLKYIQDIFGEDTGLLFDLSIGKLLKIDIEYIKKLLNLIKENSDIKRLCDMLGRFMKAEESIKIEKVLRKETFSTKIRDINSEEEIVGITYSRDIHNILPQEKLLLAEGVLETLFGVKYFENRLLTFKKEGYIDSYYDAYIEEEIQVKEEDKKGPIIICVDTSGSMKGVPETVAKAITLYLASRAMKQKRDCYLINFSTQINTMDLTYPNTMDNLIEFLRLSFNGGTDPIPALRHAIKTMNTENYKKSDLLFVSDFVFNEFREEDYKLAEAQKKNENRFYSLIIGNTPMFNVGKSLFDYNWCYDSSMGSVKEITENMYSNSNIFGS
ncbi:VWA domain-containing protein [uncultured Brachyspira sp.]|uniref:VWA domain-containing protein n=1 Tax=uncultured Brachyspira sp. TaxID=221953 RepID=UPI00262F9E8D|nr:VWA domain-containing protein [uncultured Brachyspira sp.]